MSHRATPEFWRAFEQLPQAMQRSARKNFVLLKNSPQHPSLQFKKTGRFWSVRVNIGYRALAVAVEDGQDFVWFWIGPHDKYMQIIKGD